MKSHTLRAFTIMKKKIKSIYSLPRDAISVRVDVWGMYMSIFKKTELKALRENLDKLFRNFKVLHLLKGGA